MGGLHVANFFTAGFASAALLANLLDGGPGWLAAMLTAAVAINLVCGENARRRGS
jgi:hypothetical protein